MEPKEMRKELKAAGLKCPVKNEDVIKVYNRLIIMDDTSESGDEGRDAVKELIEAPAPSVVKLVSSNVYTYIGQGDEPPHMINFMGRQQFVRGQAVEVLDPEIIEKISHHACFVRGEADTEAMFANDEKEKKRAQAQREEDVKLQIEADRANRGH